MTDEKLQEIVEHIESIKFLLDERNLTFSLPLYQFTCF